MAAFYTASPRISRNSVCGEAKNYTFSYKRGPFIRPQRSPQSCPGINSITLSNTHYQADSLKTRWQIPFIFNRKPLQTLANGTSWALVPKDSMVAENPGPAKESLSG